MKRAQVILVGIGGAFGSVIARSAKGWLTRNPCCYPSGPGQQRMADRNRGAELRFFEGGHLFLMQDPQALPAVIGFLEG